MRMGVQTTRTSLHAPQQSCVVSFRPALPLPVAILAQTKLKPIWSCNLAKVFQLELLRQDKISINSAAQFFQNTVTEQARFALCRGNRHSGTRDLGFAFTGMSLRTDH
jgi:hypothetical protein